MNNYLTGKGFLDAFAVAATTLLGNLMESIFGPGVRRPLAGNVTGADVGVFLCWILLMVVLHAIVATFLRAKIRNAEANQESHTWQTHLWRIIGQPLYLLIWIYGIYLAATPVLLKLPAPQNLHPVVRVVETFFNVGAFAAFIWACYRCTPVLETRIRSWTSRTSSKVDDLIAPLAGRTLRVLVPVLGVLFARRVLALPPEYSDVVAKASSLLLIGVVAFLAFQAVRFGEKAIMVRHDITAADNLQARKIYTQIRVLSNTACVIIAIFTGASMLMLFEEVRRFGTSILASAGVVGIVIGFAAQRTISNLFAGFQLAMAQPIRLDDVVIVENEWGRIEEITLTYVVVRIWDERRLVVPLNYFIEKPFQNWTRVSAQILGSVFLWTDYTLPVAELRPVVGRIVEGCKDWDRRFWNLQVTDTSERSVQLRILATAADASKAWDLRCEIREKVLAHIQQHHPASLPRLRAELGSASLPSATPDREAPSSAPMTAGRSHPALRPDSIRDSSQLGTPIQVESTRAVPPTA